MLADREFRQFRRKYQPMIRGVKREMDTTLQRGMVDTLVALTFSIAFAAGQRAKPAEHVKLRRWKK